MKMTKRLLSAAAALAMLSAAAPTTAAADERGMLVTYSKDNMYTVTIPSGVALSGTDTTQSKITAEGVSLKAGYSLLIKLEGGTYTTSGSSFSAKTSDGSSTATYTIGKGTDSSGLSVGDTVAEFTTDGEQPLTFSAATGISFAGVHSENLTFSIGLKDYAKDVSALTEDYEAKDGEILTGTLAGNYKISVADGANITLRGVDITNLSYDNIFAGITCDGDATITLEGENKVKGGDFKYPGIYIAPEKTLTINGSGSLEASSNGFGAGIGGGYDISCGNIIINSGTITATGGDGAAGIGGGYEVSCGNIMITGGTITATGGAYAAGIGGGYYHSLGGDITISGGTVTATGGESAAGIGSGSANSTCEDIAISGGTVTATGGKYAAGIGSGFANSTCGDILISDGTVTATGGQYAAGIGSGYVNLTCGDILISGGTVTATGGQYAAGIGGGSGGACGSITIANTVKKVTATKGEFANNSIGAGLSGSCGTVTIDETEGAISTSPYTYEPSGA